MLPHLATALRDAREKAGKKRSHAAAAADHDQSAITRFEKVKAWPRNPDQFVNAYAEVLGVDAIDLWALALARWKAADKENP